LDGTSGRQKDTHECTSDRLKEPVRVSVLRGLEEKERKRREREEGRNNNAVERK